MKQKAQKTAEIWPCQSQPGLLHVCEKLILLGLSFNFITIVLETSAGRILGHLLLTMGQKT